MTPYLRQWAPPEFMRDCRRAYRRAGSTDQGVEEAVPFRLRPKSQVRDARLVNSVRLRSRSQAHCSSSTPPTTTASSAAMNRRNAMCRTARHDLSLRCDGSNARRRDLRRSRTAGNASASCDRRSTHRFRTRAGPSSSSYRVGSVRAVRSAMMGITPGEFIRTGLRQQNGIHGITRVRAAQPSRPLLRTFGVAPATASD